MADPVYAPLACHRATRFQRTIWRVGVDWTGTYNFHMQVREIPDSASAVYMDIHSGVGMALTYAGTATVAAHVAAGRLPYAIHDQINPATGAKYADADNIALSVLDIDVGAAFTDGFPYKADHELPWEGFYDIIRQPDNTGVNDEKVVYGPFYAIPTVTRP